jgi:hypothetical protein
MTCATMRVNVPQARAMQAQKLALRLDAEQQAAGAPHAGDRFSAVRLPFVSTGMVTR